MSDEAARRCFTAGVVVLVLYNVARGLGIFGSFGDASTIGLTLVFLLIARNGGLSTVDVGLARADAPRGLRYGAVVFALVTVVLVVVALIPATSDYLDDSRADVSGPRLVFEIVVPIFLLTVIPEEFAFRGVLLATGRALWRDRRAALATSILFGLWHISPTLGTMSQNSQLDDTSNATGGKVVLVAGSVLVTFVAGLVFCWLRMRSRSLVAPILAHLSTNGVALVVAWIVVR
jgi:membrane protease YdiL (CAAX protease family)